MGVFCKNDVLNNFSRFTGEHLCHSIFFKKETLALVFACESWEILKYIFFMHHSGGCFCICFQWFPWDKRLLNKRLWHRYFPVNFAKLLKTRFLQNTSGRLLLFGVKISSKCNHCFRAHPILWYNKFKKFSFTNDSCLYIFNSI